MNINFNNNILDKKNPIILLISKPSDILNVNKFPISHREIIKKISKIKNISQKINEKVSKLNLVFDDQIIDLIIFKTEKYSMYEAQLNGSFIYDKINESKNLNFSLIVSDNILNKKNNYVFDFLTGFALKSYKFDKYFTDDKNKQKNININVYKQNKFRKKFAYDKNLVESINETKNLIAEPANILYPDSYAKRCLKLKKFGLNVKILNKNQLDKIGMRALLGVAQGSVKSPKVVIMEWKLKGSSKPNILIGKGVTFDTGGISLKPSRGMEEMIMDMGGSAVVVGCMMNAALSKSKKPLVGIIGLVENMPDANAQRPGDIIKTLSGKTVEVINTDAEGRLVLCDLLTYAQKKYKPKNIINFATLTGAIQAALGVHKAGLFSNNDKLSNSLLKSGDLVGERLWRMPLGEEYDKDIDGLMADISNIGKTPYAGASTAAQFLHRFIENNNSWAHLDIAGVTWNKFSKGVNTKGPSGFAVKLINQFLKSE
tara:strand:+ start:2487 stop:3944 length:1458 start_codon:yes stop_codon:yes gene_type:complete